MKFETILNAYSLAHYELARYVSRDTGRPLSKERADKLIRQRRIFRDRLLFLYELATNKSQCVYCGEIGPRTSEYMVEHVLSCDKRPEKALADEIIRISDRLTEIKVQS